MRKNKMVLSILFGFCSFIGTLIPANISENYLTNIKYAIKSTPFERALLKIKSQNFTNIEFNSFRSNIFQSTNHYSNAFRLLEKTHLKLEVNNQIISPEYDLADFSFDYTGQYQTSLVYSSHGFIPSIENNAGVVIEARLAMKISQTYSFDTLSQVIGKKITISGNPELIEGAAQTSKDFTISAIYYGDNKKDHLSFANLFYNSAFNYPIFMSSNNFDLFSSENNTSYYTSLVQKEGLEYVDRVLKLTLGLTKTNIGDLSFPNIYPNMPLDPNSPNLVSLQRKLKNFSNNILIVAISFVFSVLSLIFFIFIIYNEIQFYLNQNLSNIQTRIITAVDFPIISFFSISVIKYIFGNSIYHDGLYLNTINQNTLMHFLIYSTIYISIILIVSHKKKGELS